LTHYIASIKSFNTRQCRHTSTLKNCHIYVFIYLLFVHVLQLQITGI